MNERTLVKFKYSCLSLSTAEAVLQKMDDMQKMRCRLRNRDRDTKEEVITQNKHFFILKICNIIKMSDFLVQVLKANTVKGNQWHGKS